MGKRRTQEEIDLVYLERMRDTITRDLEDGRDIFAIMGSINRYSYWWQQKLNDMKKEI